MKKSYIWPIINPAFKIKGGKQGGIALVQISPEERKSLLTTKAVATSLGVDPSTLRRWIKKGKVAGPKYKDGRGWKFWTPENFEEAKSYYDFINSHR